VELEQQTKISSFFSKPPALFTTVSNAGGGKDAASSLFKTPEAKKEVIDEELIENTPENNEERDGQAATKKRKLFKLKKRSSKLGLFVASTTSLISGNLSKQPSKVHSPPTGKVVAVIQEEIVKKRPISPNATPPE
jgi:hypothetical protein